MRKTHQILSSFPMLYLNSKDLNYFLKINLYVLAREIMAAYIAEVINLVTNLDSKLSLGEQSTLYVKNLLFDNLRVLTSSV